MICSTKESLQRRISLCLVWLNLYSFLITQKSPSKRFCSITTALFKVSPPVWFNIYAILVSHTCLISLPCFARAEPNSWCGQNEYSTFTSIARWYSWLLPPTCTDKPRLLLNSSEQIPNQDGLKDLGVDFYCCLLPGLSL
jgi:hypothetical protein